jgi:hypothetical protein
MSPRTALPGRPTACRALTWLGIRASRTSAQTSAWRRVTARGVTATVERAASRSPSPRHREVPELAATADAFGIIPNPGPSSESSAVCSPNKRWVVVRPCMSSESLAKARLHVIDSEAEVVRQERMEPCPHRPDRTHDRCVPNGSATLLPGVLWPIGHRLVWCGTHFAPPMTERWRQLGG